MFCLTAELALARAVVLWFCTIPGSTAIVWFCTQPLLLMIASLFVSQRSPAVVYLAQKSAMSPVLMPESGSRCRLRGASCPLAPDNFKRWAYSFFSLARLDSEMLRVRISSEAHHATNTDALFKAHPRFVPEYFARFLSTTISRAACVKDATAAQRRWGPRNPGCHLRNVPNQSRKRHGYVDLI